jgi:hypothetical protein
MYWLFVIYLRIKSRLVNQKPDGRKCIVNNIRHSVCTTSRNHHKALSCNRQWLIVINAITLQSFWRYEGWSILTFIDFSACEGLIAWIFRSINIIAIKGCHCITAYLNGTTQITTYLHILYRGRILGVTMKSLLANSLYHQKCNLRCKVVLGALRSYI